MIRILIDMNLSKRWVLKFKAEQVYAVHWADIGAANATDFEILSYAAAHQFVVLTADLDFSTILATTRFSGPSLIQLRFDELDPDILFPIIMAALDKFDVEIKRGAVLSIDMGRNRVRLLPLL